MYRTRKRARDEGVAESRAESSRARDDGDGSPVQNFQAESPRVRDDPVASSIRKLRGEISQGKQPAHSSFSDDEEEVYPTQDHHRSVANDKVYSTILESIRSILPEGENSQRRAYDKTPARPSDGNGIFWKDKSDLDAFRARAVSDVVQASRGQETDGELNSTKALHERLARLEQLLRVTQTAPLMKQQEDHHSDSLLRLLGLSSSARNVRTGQGNTEEIHRPANFYGVPEELDSQVQARNLPRSQRNSEREKFAPPNSFPTARSRGYVDRDNVTLDSQHVMTDGVHWRTDSQVQSSVRASLRDHFESQIPSRPENSLSVIDALEMLLSGSVAGIGRRRNMHEDRYRVDSQFAANPRANSLGNLEQHISLPFPSPLPMEDYPEEIITGNIMKCSNQSKIPEGQTRGESQVQSKQRSQLHGDSDSRLSSCQPNSLPTENCLEDGATVKNKPANIQKAQGQVYSQLPGSDHAQVHEDSEPRSSAAPLNSLPMEDSSNIIIKGSPIQTLHPAQSHGDSDSHMASPSRSPKPREDSPEMLITGYVMEKGKHGEIRKATCQPLSQLPLNSSALKDSAEERKRGRKGRGCTRLDDVWNMPEGERIVCEFNEQCQPVNAEGRLLTRFLGTVVRKTNLAPLDITHWNRVPTQNKEEMWKIVESKFLIPVERKEEVKAWVLADLADKWRNHKCLLRTKYFDESKPLSELAMMCPPNVDKDQWIGLLNLWNSPKWKRISESNKKNRENLKIIHTTGAVSHAMVEAEMMGANGVAPTQAQIFAKTHRHKDGTDVNEETAKAIEEFGTRDSEADEVGNDEEGDTHSQIHGLGLGKLGRRFGKWRGLSMWNRGKSRRLQTITISREDYRSTLQQQKMMKEQLRAQDERLKGLENKMGVLLSALRDNLPQQDLADILKKATQAEVANGSGGSDPEVPRSSFNY